MRKFFAGLVVGAVLATGVTTWAVNQEVRLFVEGKEIVFTDAPPQMINGRAMVPARPLAEALGAKVAWDAETSSVVVSRATATAVPDALKPFVVKIKRGDDIGAGSAIITEGGDLALTLRTIATAGGEPVVYTNDQVMIGEVAFSTADLTSVGGESHIALALLRERLHWVTTWDATSNTLTVE